MATDTINLVKTSQMEDGDSADRARLPEHTTTGRRSPRQGRLSAQAWTLLSALALVATIALGAWLYQQWLILESELPYAATGVRLLLLVGVPVLAVIGLGSWLYARGQQARIVRLENDHPASVEAVLRGSLSETQAATLASFYAVQGAWAQHSGLRSLNQLDMSGLKPEGAKTAAPAQLEAPLDVSPVAASTWLPWLESVPHVMLAAETGGGKTTLALHLLQPRVSRGESFYIIDPNASGWGGLPSVGGGEQWPEVAAAMRAVIDLYGSRQRTRREHLERTGQELSIDAFERMTVVLDEAFMARAALDTGKDSIWRRFVPILGSGARKVAISMIVLTQTANVDDLGFSGALRENFLRIALDSGAARKLVIKEEADRRRREALLLALGGLEWPAVTEHQGQLYLLDRSGMERMPDLRSAAQQAWQPRLTLDEAGDEQQLRLLRVLKASGITRDMAREHGLQFANDLWAQA